MMIMTTTTIFFWVMVSNDQLQTLPTQPWTCIWHYQKPFCRHFWFYTLKNYSLTKFPQLEFLHFWHALSLLYHPKSFFFFWEINQIHFLTFPKYSFPMLFKIFTSTDPNFWVSERINFTGGKSPSYPKC